MQAGRRQGRRGAALSVTLLVSALTVPGGAPAERWRSLAGQHARGETAFAAGVGKQLRIPLGGLRPTRVVREDPCGSAPRRRPAPAVFRRAGEGDSRWRPSARQAGDWTLFWRRRQQRQHAPRLKVYVHVGPRAARTFRLSNVNGRSQSATLLRPADARARPSDSARVVARLRGQTPEHVPHVVYLLGGRIDRAERYWLRVRLPILPNGSSGWIPRNAVAGFRTVDTHLVIDRGRLQATLFRRGRPVLRSIIGVGEPRWPTPPGRFYVRGRLTGFADPIYGAIAFGTNGRSAVLTDWPGGGFIGVHGTNPARDPSRTCLPRLRPPAEPVDSPPRSSDANRDARDDQVAQRGRADPASAQKHFRTLRGRRRPWGARRQLRAGRGCRPRSRQTPRSRALRRSACRRPALP